MADFDLGPARIRAVVPQLVATRAALPVAPAALVVPVAGSPGPPGAPGGAVIKHTQTEPSATWVIVHDLGRRPPVTLFLTADPAEPVWTDVTYPDETTVVVDWPTPVTGTAYI